MYGKVGVRHLLYHTLSLSYFPRLREEKGMLGYCMLAPLHYQALSVVGAPCEKKDARYASGVKKELHVRRLP